LIFSFLLHENDLVEFGQTIALTVFYAFI